MDILEDFFNFPVTFFDVKDKDDTVLGPNDYKLRIWRDGKLRMVDW